MLSEVLTDIKEAMLRQPVLYRWMHGVLITLKDPAGKDLNAVC